MDTKRPPKYCHLEILKATCEVQAGNGVWGRGMAMPGSKDTWVVVSGTYTIDIQGEYSLALVLEQGPGGPCNA